MTTTNEGTERDELARVIVGAYGEDAEALCPCDQDLEVADAILAAGYRKPRSITTVEELDALPAWSLILTEQGGYWESVRRADGRNRWLEPSQPKDAWLAMSEDLALPATVLHEPEAEVGA